ncbi:MAG: class I adenylate-forming enzyme family protein [Candidatus Melainabacteria bacterium]|nr:class I adenylate-forming enzyme family protein [Candidatus Melainabacteria bacterium]
MKTTLPTAEDLLFGPAEKDRTHKAMIQTLEIGDTEFTYDQFYAAVDTFESFFLQRGLKKGDRVILISPNTVELVTSIFAAWRLELLVVPIDFRMTAPEAGNVTKSLDASLLLVSKQFKDPIKLSEVLGDLKDRMITLEECCADIKDVKPTARRSQNLDFDALMILTSGTTGTPKGAVHDLKTLVENLQELGELAELSSDMVALLPLPVSHIFGLSVVSVCLLYGATVVFCELHSATFVKAINKFKPNIMEGVPLMYSGLLAAPDGAVNLDSVRILLSGGAPLPIPMAKEFEKKYGKRLNNGYGSTESKIIALNLDGPVESIGKPVRSVKVEIINEKGEKLPQGSEGEIVIQSPHLMRGYFNQPEKTAEVLSDEGYKTGDIGYVKDGYIYISGRAKEMIVVAGNKVFPQEVEEVLQKNPIVREVAVTGPEHKKLGQIVKATIVIADKELSERLEGDDDTKKSAREEIIKNLKDFCQQNLKRELRPMEWDLRPIDKPLPKTLSGKVDRKVL